MNLNISNGEANCGVFVSLKTDTIPNKGRVKLEYIQNCPILTCPASGRIPSSSNTLCVLRHLQQHNDSRTTCDAIHIQDYVTNTYNTITKEQSNINEMRKLVDRMNLLIQNHKGTH